MIPWRVLILAAGCVAVALELLGGDFSAVDATAVLTVAGVLAVPPAVGPHA